jgi:hypothetical protein
MFDHRGKYRLDMFRDDGIAAGNQGPGARRTQQADGRPRR